MYRAREISVSDVNKMTNSEYVLIDVRKEAHFVRGPIPGAVNIPAATVCKETLEKYRNKKIVFSCYVGISSKPIAIEMMEIGFDTYSMIGGYGGWLLSYHHLHDIIYSQAPKNSKKNDK